MNVFLIKLNCAALINVVNVFLIKLNCAALQTKLVLGLNDVAGQGRKEGDEGTRR